MQQMEVSRNQEQILQYLLFNNSSINLSQSNQALYTQTLPSQNQSRSPNFHSLPCGPYFQRCDKLIKLSEIMQNYSKKVYKKMQEKKIQSGQAWKKSCGKKPKNLQHLKVYLNLLKPSSVQTGSIQIQKQKNQSNQYESRFLQKKSIKKKNALATGNKQISLCVIIVFIFLVGFLTLLIF